MTPDQLREARQRLGLTQVELAAVLGITKDHLSDCERGARAKALGPSAARLLRAYLEGYRPSDWPRR